MSTITTDPAVEQVDDDGSADQTAGDADLSGIDETLRQAAESSTKPDNGDPVAESLEARLRLLIPRHAVWRTDSALPAGLDSILSKLGEILGAEVDTGHVVVWTTGEGDWQPTGVYKVMWLACCSEHRDYRVKVDAPGVEIERDQVTADQVIDLLKATGIVR